MEIHDIVISNSSNGPIIVLFEKPTVVMLIRILSACVVDQVDRMPKERNGGTRPTSGAGKVLLDNVNWSDHGHLNALQVQVVFIYNWVKEALKDQMASGFFLVSEADINLIVKALSDYQNYKTMVIGWTHEEYGPHWGNATGFNKMDWSDQNSTLLGLLQKSE